MFIVASPIKTTMQESKKNDAVSFCNAIRDSDCESVTAFLKLHGEYVHLAFSFAYKFKYYDVLCYLMSNGYEYSISATSRRKYRRILAKKIYF